MNIILHETQIFGPVDIYAAYTKADILLIEKHEHYQKRSFRNRYDILTANGRQTLSVPLSKGKNAGIYITDVTISYDENWIVQHLQSIRSAYGKSPYFEFYFQDLEKLLLKKHKFLFDLNLESLEFTLKKLKLHVTLEYTNSYQKTYSDTIDLRKTTWNQTESRNKYTQVWAEKFEFVPNLSILDLLFCEGPHSVQVLKNIL
ncbi:MAG: WbqC family protein [Saprospiraceae bacterium]|nr:WbqC family protein [Saprospiraceae bacterium]